MQTINRHLFYILPRQPLVDWINNLDADNPLTIEDVTGNESADVYLIPEFENEEAAFEWLAEDWDMWFQNLLYTWWSEEEDFPQNRSLGMLNDFFDISYQSMVFDTQTTPLIRDEEDEDEDEDDLEEEFEEGEEEEEK